MRYCIYFSVLWLPIFASEEKHEEQDGEGAGNVSAKAVHTYVIRYVT